MDNTREKIVVVEADEASRASLVSILESGGWEVSAFATTREGLDTLQHAGADLLLLDTDLLCAGTLTAHHMLTKSRQLATAPSPAPPAYSWRVEITRQNSRLRGHICLSVLARLRRDYPRTLIVIPR